MKFVNFLSFKGFVAGLALLPSMAFSAWVHFDPADTSKVPKLFSKTGFYSSMATKTVTSEAVLYEVNSALWSDNAHKYRWVLLKPGSEKIKFDPIKDYYEYPEGTVFVKLFKQDTVAGDTTSRIFWETRVLINKKMVDTVNNVPVLHDVWYPFSYRWNAAGTDAELVSSSGAIASMNLTVKGQKTFRKWFFPGEQACVACHRQFKNGVQGRTVLGFFTAQLNRPVPNNATLNQIRNLFTKNIFTASPVPTDAEITAMPKWAAITDSSAPLDLRAKAYIASNCSGCHGTRGIGTDAIYPAGEQFNYDFHTQTSGQMNWAVDLRTVLSRQFEGMPVVVKPSGDTLLPGVVVPGYPQISTALFRMKARNLKPPAEEGAYAALGEQMPPLGVYEEDTVATRILSQWITTMPAAPIHGRRLEKNANLAPRLSGSYLTLPSSYTGRVYVSGIDGRRTELQRVSGTLYRLPDQKATGVLLIHLEKRSFKLVR
jgi:hypothetical protein